MKENHFRRFNLAEVFIHGLHAIFYLILFITGLILIFQRSFEINFLPPKTLSIIHRITGIVLVIYLLQVLLLSFIAPSFRIIWKTISEAMSWGLRDFIWLFKVPFHFLFHWISLPPSGKYNPGQKLNILVVLFTVTGLSFSGLWMILFPGTLIAWYIHIACFLLGAVLLALHLYLSLINPPTRKAIKGMITGYVTIQYVREHHQLCLDEPVSKKRHIHLYRYPFILLVFGILVTLFAGSYFYGPQRLKSQILKIGHSRGLIAMLPGSLTLSHANEISDLECTRCHNLETRLPSDKCIHCHEIIAERINDNSGYHGRFTENCVTCHKEHQGLNAEIRPLDKEAFNHQLANFHLDGKHSELDCEKCHQVQDETADKDKPVTIRYITSNYETCQSCHVDVHVAKFTQSCTTCHQTSSWQDKNLIFNHDEDTSFTLDAVHKNLSCNECHTSGDMTFQAKGTECSDCHEEQVNAMQGKSQNLQVEPDPHYNRVSCTDCHEINKSNQSIDIFARRCSDCHNDQYIELAFQWAKTFEKQRNSVELMLENNNEASEQLKVDLSDAIESGFHNLQLTRQLYIQILQNVQDENAGKEN